MRTLSMDAIVHHPEYLHLSRLAVDIDLKYASADNFVGRDLYSPLDCAWLHHDAASALADAAGALHRLNPGYRLRVYDALRPQRVQEALWEALAGTDLRMYLADPVRGSIHSFGMAVDVTVSDADGTVLDMGTGFDDLTVFSHPALESDHRRDGVLSERQISHRQLLRAVMTGAGFQGIRTEWWHFDFGDRETVRRNYARIL
jgi:zinc D-Ala-D-Ala dipeptidase